MTQDLLVEIGAEDLPPHVVDDLRAQLETSSKRALEEARLGFESLEVYSAPRRLALWVHSLEDRQPDRQFEVKGPPRKVAFDAQGRPTKAAEGFCKDHGAQVQDAVVKAAEGGEYLFLTVHQQGKPAPEVLIDVLPRVLEGLKPAETMRWGAGVRFTRPIRWLLALYGETVLPFRWAGLEASNKSCGHRFLQGELTIKRAGQYATQLAAHGVLVKPQERQAQVQTQLEQIGAQWNAQCRPTPALLHQLVHSGECPNAVDGQFDERFLSLPTEVLSTTMINHQRFVPCYHRETGKILPRFVGFRDGAPTQTEPVRLGYERVLRARLVDSEFFFAEDRKRTLEAYTKDLKSVVYQARLGSIWDKAQRIRSLAQALGKALQLPPRQLEALDRAAYLCKADLVTLMVGEFPELQGAMGAVYAALDGESEAVAQAIGQHYLPQGPDDPLPDPQLGVLLSLADKLDTLVGSLLIGHKPTGSRDPFGLRRAANAIVRMVLQRRLHVDLFALLEQQRSLYEFISDPGPWEAVESFLGERLQQALRQEYGVAHDIAEAVIAPGDGHFLNVLGKAHSLEKLRGSEAFRSLTFACSRVGNILGKADITLRAYDPKLFTDQAERDLWKALLKSQTQIEKRLPEDDFDGILQQLIALRPHIDQYFDEVLVMSEDQALRQNRLGFLAEVASQFMVIGDLSKVVVES